ncbi:Uncharacterised protein [Salmonella enterica subsp. salamae]|uniref:Uncharacterized protein n=1 Tax=Salmonella enterica TaxID=28901 RepID=A0A379QYJ4_SALER|nr:Uncharacterised protein [Salmonella enterica]SUI19982.1 Uncharacterised protein [Salmonella enterica subsp. salamae]
MRCFIDLKQFADCNIIATNNHCLSLFCKLINFRNLLLLYINKVNKKTHIIDINDVGLWNQYGLVVAINNNLAGAITGQRI